MMTCLDILTRYLYRPFQMLIREPILLLITIYLDLIYRVLDFFFVAYPVSFQEESGWNLGVGALPSIGLTVGVIIGVIVVSWITKIHFARKPKEHGRVVAEERLPPMIIGGILLPKGLSWLVWTSDKIIVWLPPVLTGILLGMGVFTIFMQWLGYLIGVYLMFANAPTAAKVILRSLAGAGFRLFASQMYHTLGVDWARYPAGFPSRRHDSSTHPFFIYMGRRSGR